MELSFSSEASERASVVLPTWRGPRSPTAGNRVKRSLITGLIARSIITLKLCHAIALLQGRFDMFPPRRKRFLLCAHRRADPARVSRILARMGNGNPPVEGDELPLKFPARKVRKKVTRSHKGAENTLGETAQCILTLAASWKTLYQRCKGADRTNNYSSARE